MAAVDFEEPRCYRRAVKAASARSKSSPPSSPHPDRPGPEAQRRLPPWRDVGGSTVRAKDHEAIRFPSFRIYSAGVNGRSVETSRAPVTRLNDVINRVRGRGKFSSSRAASTERVAPIVSTSDSIRA